MAPGERWHGRRFRFSPDIYVTVVLCYIVVIPSRRAYKLPAQRPKLSPAVTLRIVCAVCPGLGVAHSKGT
jgi:hypothetical protein